MADKQPMLYDLWRESVHEGPHDVALAELETGRRWTFAELDRAADLAPDRSAHSVRIISGRGAGFVIEVLAAWRAGKVVCPLDEPQAPPAFTLPPDCAHLKQTSATTGAPRWIAFTGEQLAADAAQIVRTMGLRREWPNVGAISLSHSYGFSNLILPLLLHRIPLLLAPGHLPELIQRAAAEASGVVLAGVPALWRAWHETRAIPASVRLAISAGAPLPLALEQAVFKSNGLKIHNFYGSSECGGIAFDRSETPRADAAYAGQPMEGVELAQADDGCLAVRSGAVGIGYCPSPDSRLGGGLFLTADLAEIVGANLYLRGRAGDVIHVAGRKINPEAIEDALLGHPAVESCVVFGVPAETEERISVVVAGIPASCAAALPQIRQHARRHLKDWQCPKLWWLVTDLQPNARGKLSRTAWRERYLREKGG